MPGKTNIQRERERGVDIATSMQLKGTDSIRPFNLLNNGSVASRRAVFA